ncbi:amidohydrolase [Actinocorallia sp. API 0066]|uniref:amidohydrolase n=1 Tax=Actinocorallia sp. API 0066 TaxID=2896846 RepID=UPI001E580CD7|nr:amidohydrolase [Actinocorallia sp. API 0066]MCD0451710.1 amidohydrolase [Actinocorallia sp. API 0066]
MQDTGAAAGRERRIPDDWHDRYGAALAELYRDLHRHPELSFQEHRTAAVLAAELRKTSAEVTEGVGGTGVVAVLANGDGPVVMLRADIDALPMEEKTGLPYASTATGTDPEGVTGPVMHACGHDMHAVCLLGAVVLLDELRSSWSGTVVAVFQPAEEVAAGARAMLDDGLLDRFPRPSVVLGQHVGPLPAGMVGHRSGPVMAALDALRVRLFGRGGHGSRPENTVDPIVMAASTVLRLQGIVAREVAAAEAAVVTVGSLRAGTKDNIIPDHADLGISVRTFTPQVRERVLAAVTRIVNGEAAVSGAERVPEISREHGTPVLVSDPAATDRTVAAFAGHFGSDALLPMPQLTGSEDVGYLGAAAGVPTVFWFWGGLDRDTVLTAFAEGRFERDIPGNHSSLFAPVVEPTLRTGVEALTVAALTWLGAGAGGREVVVGRG